MENEGEVKAYKEGIVTSPVNVREEAGAEHPKVMVHNKGVALKKGTLVKILDEVKVSQRTWYHIAVEYDGEEITGYSTSSYIKETGKMITPVPTEAVTATPVPTIEVTVTEVPQLTASVTPEVISPQSEKKEIVDFQGIVLYIGIIIAAAVIAAIVYHFRKNAARKKEKTVNNANNAKQKAEIELNHPKIGKRSEIFEDKVADDVYIKSEKEIIASKLPESIVGNREEKAAIREMVNHLKEHDIIIHKYFGRGEVYDNSDVKLIEIRFKSGDSRFFNKEQLISQMMIQKEEKQTK